MTREQVFAYWDGDDHRHLADFLAEWRGAFPQFRLFGNEDVQPLLTKHFPRHAALFDLLSIAAAKADIARLVLLHEYGGLYVDCHCGILDRGGIGALLDLLTEQEAVLVDRRLSLEPRPEDEHFFINSILFVRKGSPLTRMLARQALANLEVLRDFERDFHWVPYHIGALSGPSLLTAMMLQPCTSNREIRRDYRGRVAIVREEVVPIVRYRTRTYGGPGLHWSERQRTQPLFRLAPAVNASDLRDGKQPSAETG